MKLVLESEATCGPSGEARSSGPLRTCILCALFVALQAGFLRPAGADFSGLQRLATGAGAITNIAFAPNDPTRMYVARRNGIIRIFDLQTNSLLPGNFLAITGLDTAVEGGLLGMAFHPDYAQNGKFYVSVTEDNGGIQIGPGFNDTSPFSSQIREYGVSANPLAADTSYSKLIEIVQPQPIHNGGWLGFSPRDRYLYAAFGDGGGAYDSAVGHTTGIGNAQDVTDNLLGKILRVDVDHDDFPEDSLRNYAIPASNPFVGEEGDDEIWAYGLRSPWKASFDRATGDMWLGDVGQSTREEVDFIAGTSGGGENFGWRMREGSEATVGGQVGGPAPEGAIEPAYDYVHVSLPGDVEFQGNSVIGGYLYRGPDPEARGKYLFADFSANKFWTFDPVDPYGTVANVTATLTSPDGPATYISAFGEDPLGNLFVATINGEIYRVLTDAWTPGDFDGDGEVDAADLAIQAAHFGSASGASRTVGDANGDATIDGADFLEWQRHAGTSPLQVLITPSAGSVPEAPALALAAASLAACAAAKRRPAPAR